jgi:hypothetical protein
MLDYFSDTFSARNTYPALCGSFSLIEGATRLLAAILCAAAAFCAVLGQPPPHARTAATVRSDTVLAE